MRVRLVAFLLIGSGASMLAGLAPLSLKDVSLMLRSGYSAAEVEREVRTRHFADPIDATAEKALLQAGASAAFVASLKSGAYAVPAAELAAVQQELAAKAQRRAAQADEARKLNTLYQAQQTESRAAAAAASAGQPNSIAPLVKGDLVSSKNGVLSPHPDTAFEKKTMIGLYFSAHWCGPCRKFTPELVAFYNRVAGAHPEFEILFVSNDKSAAEMQGYMREAQMPWPAVSFDKIPNKAALTKYAGSGIPCLVVVDASGKVISDTYAGKNYIGPSKVLADLEQMFAPKPDVTQVALQR
jgi:nucleoredoxin